MSTKGEQLLASVSTAAEIVAQSDREARKNRESLYGKIVRAYEEGVRPYELIRESRLSRGTVYGLIRPADRDD